ncbi:MAG: DMT family transporter [bacterium]
MVSTIGELAALATAFCWTVSALCWTAAGRRVGSLAVNIVRLLIALPMFLLYNQLVLGEMVPFSASPHAWGWLSLSGVAGFFLCDLFFFRSFLLIGPRRALLIFSMAPPLSALFGWILLEEHLTRWNWIGMATTLAGILWVILESSDRGTEGAEGEQRRMVRGGVYAFLAAVAQGLATVLCKVGMRDLTSPVAGTEIRLISGLACFLVLIPLLGRQGQVVRALRDGPAMAIMTLGAFVGPFVGVSLLLFAVKLIPAALAQTFVSLSPVLIIPASAVVFKERISARAVGGAGLAVLGVALLFL